uniref:uncharacterized protein LOC101304100 n=1 Tax=Fragaria vesca subsp. vesca TaxID=101020 RepID=UPI0005C9EB2F|nr:PREDICTED: uncharacterized protein LOC101304100 [Fragaria vesca subsp. vesca]
MDGFSLTLTTHTPFFTNRTRFPSLSRAPIPVFPPKNTNFIVYSSKDEPKLDPLDQMELKFGRMIGEDPKLTLAKILGRKANPEASYMDIEKSFYKNKGKIVEIKEVPFGVPKNAEVSKPMEGLGLDMVRPVPKKVKSSPLDGLNLARPVPKKGVKFEVDDKPRGSEVKKLSRPVAPKGVDGSKGSVPNVILRKPSLFSEDDVEDTRSRLRIKPNLSLKMRIEQPKEKFSDMTLLRKPEPVIVDEDSEKKQDESSSSVGRNGVGDMTLLRKPEAESINGSIGKIQEQSSSVDMSVIGDAEMEMLSEEVNNEVSGFTLLEKPKALSMEKNIESDNEEFEQEESSVIVDTDGFKDLSEVAATSDLRRPSLEESRDGLLAKIPSQTDDYPIGLQPHKQSTMASSKEVIDEDEMSSTSSPDSNVELYVDAALQGKPKRLDQPVKKASVNAESIAAELENPLSTSPSGHEDADWIAAEELVKTGNRGDVEVISASTRGFVVSFRSLVGFLPYRNLAFKWKFLAFESWLRRKGLDPSLYRRNLGIIGSYDVTNKINPSLENDDIVIKNEGEVTPDMTLEELLGIYDQEKIKFLSSFIGQKIKVNVVLANKNSGKLVFSVKPKEKEESIQRKRSLMAKLQVGDVVKCCIKKITYFGVFVEVEGVPALIHQSEISWDATVDPSSYFKVGQILEAKVYQLDFALERIFLSLKEIMPDPLMETLESVVGDNQTLDGRLKAAEADTEWDDVESLIKELEQTEGIQSVSKGRFFLSPGLAPTFQVYMASMFENQYKLLARSENKVQEVIVQTSLDKEEMKSVILRCTSRVG